MISLDNVEKENTTGSSINNSATTRKCQGGLGKHWVTCRMGNFITVGEGNPSAHSKHFLLLILQE
jgi:hypothetical protein